MDDLLYCIEAGLVIQNEQNPHNNNVVKSGKSIMEKCTSFEWNSAHLKHDMIDCDNSPALTFLTFMAARFMMVCPATSILEYLKKSVR